MKRGTYTDTNAMLLMKPATDVPPQWEETDCANVLGLPTGDHWPERKRKRKKKRNANKQQK